jgi:hypothetical protein
VTARNVRITTRVRREERRETREERREKREERSRMCHDRGKNEQNLSCTRLFPFASSAIAILFELSSKATDACARDVGAADGADPLESLHDGVIGRG